MEEDPAHDITVARVVEFPTVSDEPLIRAVRAALTRHESPSARISLALVDDERIATLNARHCRHEGPTDVLTFDLGAADAPDVHDPGGSVGVEGEIVLSVETAAREAGARGHGVDAEAALYAVHGTLHLLGYDDATAEGAAAMHALEDEILTLVGIGPVYSEARPEARR